MSISGDWDRRISRRTLLKTGGSFAAGVALAGLASDRAFAQATFPSYPFKCGVASGDPTPDGFVLWTRLVPDPLAVGGGLPAEPYEVRYELARDPDFRYIHRQGTTAAVADEAHSVRVEIGDLPPEREYWYRFKAGDEISPVGRTRTGPPGNSMVRLVTFAFVSCQNFADGYFTSYEEVANDPAVEAVIFLGDYIYEGGARAIRAHAPARVIKSLDEYRIRHGQYKTDVHLQAAHAAHPWLVTWDDHEFRNNYADLDLDEVPEVSVEDARQRRQNAYQAYWEHMPLSRSRKPVEADLQLYRRFHWGKLITFNVLDGRQYRSDQVDACPQRDPSGYCTGVLDPQRTMLGAEQLDWLLNELATTKTRWNVLAQQTMFSPFNRTTVTGAAPRFDTFDSWDGYVAERQRILDWIVAQRTENPVVLTGDTHQHWVRNVPGDYRDLGRAPVATELMGTSVSTGGDPSSPSTRRNDDPNNPHVLFRNNERGYVRSVVTPDRWTSEYRRTKVAQPSAPCSGLTTAVIENGVRGAQLIPE